MPSPPAPSQTDPYAPEPSAETQPVWILLVYAETVVDGHKVPGRRVPVQSDVRAMRARVVRRDGVVFDRRGDDYVSGKWHRLFVECEVLEV